MGGRFHRLGGAAKGGGIFVTLAASRGGFGQIATVGLIACLLHALGLRIHPFSCTVGQQAARSTQQIRAHGRALLLRLSLQMVDARFQHTGRFARAGHGAAGVVDAGRDSGPSELRRSA